MDGRVGEAPARPRPKTAGVPSVAPCTNILRRCRQTGHG